MNYSILNDPDPVGQRFRAATVGYFYALQTGEEAEIVAYHWNPQADRMSSRPHAHVGRGLISTPLRLDIEDFDLPKIHIPTGRISLADVIRLAISQLRVEPRRAEWAKVLGW